MKINFQIILDEDAKNVYTENSKSNKARGDVEFCETSIFGHWTNVGAIMHSLRFAFQVDYLGRSNSNEEISDNEI